MATFTSYVASAAILKEDSKEKKPTHFEVAYKMFDKKGQIVSKRKAFKTDKARAKFVEKIKQDGNFYDIAGYLDE